MGSDTQREHADGVNWEELLARLSPSMRKRFDQLLRRALVRQTSASMQDASAVPQIVRAKAVGEYRSKYMKGYSRGAQRRMKYEQLRGDATFRALERELLARYLKRRASGAGDGKESELLYLSSKDLRRNVAGLPLAQACEAYRELQPTQLDPALEQFACEAYREACEQSDLAARTLEGLAERVCGIAREQDLSSCARVSSLALPTPEPVVHRHGKRVSYAQGESYRRQGFHVQDLTSFEEVAERVARAGLVDGILAKIPARKHVHGRGTAGVVEDVLATKLRHEDAVRAANALLSAICGPAFSGTRIYRRALRRQAADIACELHGDAFAERLARAVLENPRYEQQFERAVELKLRVRENVPSTPMEAYPLARMMHRRFVLHVGPTNSGKTHDALEALMAAESGAYLGPLRLLAYEQFELLNREGCPCTLLTGEELAEVVGARHVSSTVEMADFHTPIDVAVIDEAQMVADPGRGFHWTAAILGMPAREVHVCCAPHAAAVVRQLVTLCGDECRTLEHERLVPLRPDRGSFRLPADVQPGDALIVFSRRSVHAVAAQVSAAGLRPSLVYGALPHDVRHEEARRFDDGETDVVVATDAIGMGMNLPIRRIVFVEQEKFDGRSTRMLRPEEVQQIAGRAGRFGRYDVGFYQSTRLRSQIRELYGRKVARIESIPVGIPDNIALVRDATLLESIQQWMGIEQPKPFERVDVARDLALIGEVEARLGEPATEVATKQLILSLATMAFDEHDPLLRGVWRQMVEAELAGEEAMLAVPPAPQPGARLADLEADYRYCDLLYTYARTFDHPRNKDLLVERRTQISHAIMELLVAASNGT